MICGGLHRNALGIFCTCTETEDSAPLESNTLWNDCLSPQFSEYDEAYDDAGDDAAESKSATTSAGGGGGTTPTSKTDARKNKSKRTKILITSTALLILFLGWYYCTTFRQSDLIQCAENRNMTECSANHIG